MDALNDLPVNAVDIVVLLVLLTSAVLAYARGFVRELLSVVGWIGAIFATIYGYPYAQPIAARFIPFDLAANLTAGVVIFIATLVFLTLISSAIARQVHASSLNVLDRSLGFLFGLARGAVLLIVAFIGMELLIPEAERPAIVREARTMQLIEPGAAWLKSILPSRLKGKLSIPEDEAPAKGTRNPAVEQLLSPSPKSQKQAPAEGYPKDQRKSLDRLYDGVGSNQ